MDKVAYLKDRVENQITWMSRIAGSNQRRYTLLKALEILAAALIPFLAGYHNVHELFSVATAVLGVFIVVINGLQQLHKYHENWLTYRTVAEALKREKFLFESAAEPYRDVNAFPQFVQNVEALLANENKIWKATRTQKAESKQA